MQLKAESAKNKAMKKIKKARAPIPEIPLGSSLVDSHCHLDMDVYSTDLEAVLKRAQQQGIHSIITIGIDEVSSAAAIEIAKAYPMVKASVGIHPHDVENTDEQSYQRLKTLITENRAYVVAYGEIGLDYAKLYADAAIQRKVFRKQLQLAKELQLPVIIHDRDAHDDTMEILESNGPYAKGGVMHCFSGDMKLAEKVLALGFHISIPGVVTFKNGQMLQAVVKEVPLESLLIETDGPFLSPVPWRGKRNEPSYLAYTAAAVATLKGTSIQDVAKQTSSNVEKLFGYSPLPQEQ